MRLRHLLLADILPSVAIEATKDGVKFSCTGDIGNGAVTLRSHTNVENPDKNIDISLSEPVALTFSLKYLVNFCKASGLSGTVKLCLSNEVPLLVEYTLASNSYLRFYLAPKVRNANFGPVILFFTILTNRSRNCRLGTKNSRICPTSSCYICHSPLWGPASRNPKGWLRE